MEKSNLESMHYCYLTTKNILGPKNTKKMDFQILKFLLFFGPPYHALTHIQNFQTNKLHLKGHKIFFL